MSEINPWIPLVMGGAAFGYFMLRRPSEHFTWDEWTTTNSGLPNSIGGDLPSMIRVWMTSNQILEPIRLDTGPLQITSGYRTRAVNDAVGGDDESQHLLGDGVDLTPPTGWDAEDFASYLSGRDDLPMRQVIWYTPDQGGHVHIGRGTSARQYLYKDSNGYHDWTPSNVSYT